MADHVNPLRATGQLMFNTGVQYLDPKEKEIQADLIENLPGIRDVFKKGKEKRKVTQIVFPIGAMTNETILGAKDENDRTQPYWTPCATLEFGPKVKVKEALISFLDIESGQWGRVTASEWLKWIRDGNVTITPHRTKTEVSKESAARLLKMKTMRNQGHFGKPDDAPGFAEEAAKTDKLPKEPDKK